MALRRTSFAKRFFNEKKHPSSPSHMAITSEYPPTFPPNIPTKSMFYREFLTSPDSSRTGLFRRFFQLRGINQSASRLPEFLYIPVGDKLRHTLKSLNPNNSGDYSRMDLLTPPSTTTAIIPEEESEVFESSVTAEDVRKIMRTWQMEKVKEKLREISMNSISYAEYVRICNEASNDHAPGGEIAKMLDQSGNVIVLGNVVFLRPEQVAKSVEQLIHQAIGKPNDPRMNELKEMEMKKSMIDQKAKSMVKAELYGGLGFLALQTLCFMRLTFWELSWDVMEPICFFTASIHFGLAYCFFLRTSKEPSFEGYFQRRFKVKQMKLMKQHNFNVDKYNQLCKVFHSMGSMGYGPKDPTFSVVNSY